MSKLRVLHVVTISFTLPYFIGNQFKYFKEKGVDYFVVASPSSHFLAYADEMSFKPFPIIISRTFSPIQDFKSILAVRKVILENKIDLVIGHTPKGGLIAMIAAYISGLRNSVYVRHGIMFETSKGLKRILLIAVEKLTGALAKKVVCVSPSILKISNKKNLSRHSKNFLLGRGTCNGINGSRFNRLNIPTSTINDLKLHYDIQPNELIVGFVGRIVNDKGINELYEAWQIVKKKLANVKLMLVGPFEERDGIPSDLKAKIIADKTIICTGLINDAAPFYALMNVFVLPSYREGFPTVVLEASAMELPILTTRVTGCQDAIVHQESGMFISFEPNDIAQKIIDYLLNKTLANQHGKNGRKFVLENFEEKIVWKDIETKLLTI